MTPPSRIEAQQARINVFGVEIDLRGTIVKKLPVWASVTALGLAGWVAFQMTTVKQDVSEMKGEVKTIISLLREQ